jgi:hypothetical protein
MKKSILLLGIAWLAMSTAAMAQDKGACCKTGDGVKQGPCPMSQLDLTDAQKAKLKALDSEFRTKDSLMISEFKGKHQQLQAEREKIFSTILTKEQLLKRDSLKTQRMYKPKKECGMKPAQGCKQGQGCEQSQGCKQGPNSGQEQCCKHAQGCKQGQGRKQGGGCMKAQQAPGCCEAGQAPMMCQKGHGKHQMKMDGRFVPKHQDFALVNPEERIKASVDKMTKELNLSPEQADKITQIHRKYAKNEIARYQKVKKQHDARLKKQTAKKDEIKAVLTEEQIKKLDEMKKNIPTK